MAKIEVRCPCGKVFTMKADQTKNCPRCGKQHRGPDVPA